MMKHLHIEFKNEEEAIKFFDEIEKWCDEIKDCDSDDCSKCKAQIAKEKGYIKKSELEVAKEKFYHSKYSNEGSVSGNWNYVCKAVDYIEKLENRIKQLEENQ